MMNKEIRNKEWKEFIQIGITTEEMNLIMDNVGEDYDFDLYGGRFVLFEVDEFGSSYGKPVAYSVLGIIDHCIEDIERTFAFNAFYKAFSIYQLYHETKKGKDLKKLRTLRKRVDRYMFESSLITNEFINKFEHVLKRNESKGVCVNE